MGLCSVWRGCLPLRRGVGLGDWGLGRWARAWTMTASKAGGRSETPRGVTINLRNLEAWRSKGWLQTSKKDGVALGVGVGLGLHGEIVVLMECAELGSNLAVTSSSKLGSEISALVTHLPRGGIWRQGMAFSPGWSMDWNSEERSSKWHALRLSCCEDHEGGRRLWRRLGWGGRSLQRGRRR